MNYLVTVHEGRYREWGFPEEPLLHPGTIRLEHFGDIVPFSGCVTLYTIVLSLAASDVCVNVKFNGQDLKPYDKKEKNNFY